MRIAPLRDYFMLEGNYVKKHHRYRHRRRTRIAAATITPGFITTRPTTLSLITTLAHSPSCASRPCVTTS